MDARDFIMGQEGTVRDWAYQGMTRGQYESARENGFYPRNFARTKEAVETYGPIVVVRFPLPFDYDLHPPMDTAPRHGPPHEDDPDLPPQPDDDWYYDHNARHADEQARLASKVKITPDQIQVDISTTPAVEKWVPITKTTWTAQGVRSARAAAARRAWAAADDENYAGQAVQGPEQMGLPDPDELEDEDVLPESKAQHVVALLLDDVPQMAAGMRSQQPRTADWPGGFEAHYPNGRVYKVLGVPLKLLRQQDAYSVTDQYMEGFKTLEGWTDQGLRANSGRLMAHRKGDKEYAEQEMEKKIKEHEQRGAKVRRLLPIKYKGNVAEGRRQNRYNPKGLGIDRHGVLRDKWGRERTTDWDAFHKKRKKASDVLKPYSKGDMNPMHNAS